MQKEMIEKAEKKLETAMVKDYFSLDDFYEFICYFENLESENNSRSKAKILELKCAALAHAIVRPSALHEFQVTNNMIDIAASCVKNERLKEAEAFLEAADAYLSSLADKDEEFYLHTDELTNAHKSFLGIAYVWGLIAEQSIDPEQKERGWKKKSRILQERIEKYFGDRYKNFMN